MNIKIDETIVELAKGDITEQNVDVIINAANNRLTPGGGVSGAIHRAAGPKLWEDCKEIGGCKTGESKITKGYNLLAKYVIHTVGPVYSGKEKDEQLLKKCYVNCLMLASQYGLKSIAFPAISIGVYGYPIIEAAKITVESIAKFLKKEQNFELIKIVLFSDRAYKNYKKALEGLIKDDTE